MALQCHLEWLLAGSALLVRWEGVVDVAAGQRLVRVVERFRGVDALVLDLGGAAVQDAALALLAPALAARHACRVVVRGLSRHQDRLLRYLGAPAPAPAPEGWSGR